MLMSIIVKIGQEFENKLKPCRLSIYKTYKYLLVSGESRDLRRLMRKLKSENVEFEVIIQSP